MMERYTPAAIAARHRRNRRSGASQQRRERWMAWNDVEWAFRRVLQFWRWQDEQEARWLAWRRQWEEAQMLAWQRQEEERTRKVLEDTRRWQELDRWLRQKWAEAGERVGHPRVQQEEEQQEGHGSWAMWCCLGR